MEKESTNKVIQKAYLDYRPNIVAIDEDKIMSFKMKISEQVLGDNENQALAGKSLEEGVKFLLALNSINYQYWDLDEKNKTFTRYSNNNNVGALAAFEGFTYLWNEIKYTPDMYKIINESIVEEFFGNIPDKKGRVNIFQESLSPIILEKAFQVIHEDVLKNKLINVNTAQKVADIMPVSFSDDYLKKIQLSLYEIALHYKSRGFDTKFDLTVAADYQVPKVLENMGVLQYSESLKDKIKNREIIEENSEEENAIRAATIIACHSITKIHNISIDKLDRALWLARNDVKDKNFHLTKTRKY